MLGKFVFEEHRNLILRAAQNSPIAQVVADELYFTLLLDEMSLAITILADATRSLIIDIDTFRGNQLTQIDAMRLRNRNDMIFTNASFFVTDGARAYTYAIDGLDSIRHIICLQHVTRNKRKTAQIKKLIASLIDAEREWQITRFDEFVNEKRKELERRLSYSFPGNSSLSKKYRTAFLQAFDELVSLEQKKFKEHLERYLESYAAYIHRLLYVKQYAALIGKLRQEHLGGSCEKAIDDNRGDVSSDCRRSKNVLKKLLKVEVTTAFVEGLNRPLRGRIRRSVGFKSDRRIIGIVRLYAVKHNTLSVQAGGRTPYELIGIDPSEMRWNPYVGLMANLRRNPIARRVSDIRIHKEIYRSWRSKRAILKPPWLHDDEINRFLRGIIEVREMLISG